MFTCEHISTGRNLKEEGPQPPMSMHRFYKFCLLIDGIHKNIYKLKVDLAPYLGVKSVHIFWIYELLSHSDGLTAAELASRSMISRSLISREIEELRREGYICIEETAHGKRKNYNSRITLTQAGRNMANYISSLGVRIQQSADLGITEEELKSFYLTLEKLSTNLARISQEIEFAELPPANTENI